MPDFNREGVWWIEAADCLIRQMLQHLGHVHPLGHDHAGLRLSRELKTLKKTIAAARRLFPLCWASKSTEQSYRTCPSSITLCLDVRLKLNSESWAIRVDKTEENGTLGASRSRWAQATLNNVETRLDSLPCYARTEERALFPAFKFAHDLCVLFAVGTATRAAV